MTPPSSVGFEGDESLRAVRSSAVGPATLGEGAIGATLGARAAGATVGGATGEGVAAGTPGAGRDGRGFVAVTGLVGSDSGSARGKALSVDGQNENTTAARRRTARTGPRTRQRMSEE